jgi:hypothetical protein
MVGLAEGYIMETEFVSLKQIAETLGMDRSAARKYVLKLGIKPQKRRTAESRNQLSLAVSGEQAKMILKIREDYGFSASGKPAESEHGCFYVIQLVPELDARRIKLGFAIDLHDRLSQHKTAAPTAKVLKSWPCKRSWELTAMDCLSVTHCRHILNEVFECDSIDELLKKGDDLFALLPEPGKRKELSEYSPLR